MLESATWRGPGLGHCLTDCWEVPRAGGRWCGSLPAGSPAPARLQDSPGSRTPIPSHSGRVYVGKGSSLWGPPPSSRCPSLGVSCLLGGGSWSPTVQCVQVLGLGSEWGWIVCIPQICSPSRGLTPCRASRKRTQEPPGRGSSGPWILATWGLLPRVPCLQAPALCCPLLPSQALRPLRPAGGQGGHLVWMFL